MKLIDISTPKHPNTFTMVDDADFEWLSKWKWRMDHQGYVRRNYSLDGKRKTVFMHTEILKTPPGMLGDHRFGNKLDHRRENLRVCTKAENTRNMRVRSNRPLPKGVVRMPNNKFLAQIMVDYRQIHLGVFCTAPEAESARIAASKKYHGEFARITAGAEA